MKRIATLLATSLLLSACSGLRPGPASPPPAGQPLPPSQQPQPTTPGMPAQPSMTSLSGQATFTASEPVPPTAKLTVSLYSASAGDTPAGRIAQRTLFVKQQGQVPFRLDYAPSRVQSGERYLLSGRILLGGRPLFLTQDPVAVDLGSGGEVELPLQPVR
ncbi:lipoprotein [Pseudomonas oryzihabitans]|nr:lipoprotein [Pseudomonas psychrotolerans]